MSENINIVLQEMIERKASEFSLEKEKRPHTGSIISIFLEEWDLFAWLEHPLVPTLEIQCSISVKGDFVRAVWLPNPTLLTPETRTDFTLFANEANLELHSGGRFWCNDEMDFAYEIVLTKEMIEKCEAEAARLFFDVPYSSYQDFHIPLSMLKKGVWRSDTAIQYIRELRSKGFVDNSDYDIW